MTRQYILGLPLPSSTQALLSRYFFGIPQAKWIDPLYLHIHIASLKKELQEIDMIDIKQFLSEQSYPLYFFTPLCWDLLKKNHHTYLILQGSLEPSIEPLKRQMPQQEKTSLPYILLAEIPPRSHWNPFSMEPAHLAIPPFNATSIAIYTHTEPGVRFESKEEYDFSSKKPL